MIVRNEEHVLERGLRSVAPLVQAVYITDTGSMDRTMDVARQVCHALGIELHLAQDEWTDDFGRNRQQALERVSHACTHVLFADADESWHYEDGFQWPALTHDMYMIYSHLGSPYPRGLLVRNDDSYRWRGARHEGLFFTSAHGRAEQRGTLTSVWNVPHQDSARAHDPLRFHKDAVALKREHEHDPTNTRTVFYLARTLASIGDARGAMTYNALRAAMPGFDEERMEAQYALAKLWEAHAPERSAQEIDRAFMRAYWLAPHRIEPLFALVQRMRVRGDHFQAYLLASMALMRLHADPDKSEHGVPRAAQLFVQQWQYESGLATELGLAAARMGDWEHAERVLESVTQVPSLRDAHGGDADVVRGNLAYVRRAKWGAQDEAERERERLCESLF